MNQNIHIAQNEIINLAQSLQQSLGLSYQEVILAMGFAEGRLAQMDSTQRAYESRAELMKESVKPTETPTETQATCEE